MAQTAIKILGNVVVNHEDCRAIFMLRQQLTSVWEGGGKEEEDPNTALLHSIF